LPPQSSLERRERKRRKNLYVGRTVLPILATAIDELCVCRGQPKDEGKDILEEVEEDNNYYGTQLKRGSSEDVLRTAS